jgi:hypothetical protein
MNKVLYTYTMEYYSVFKKKEKSVICENIDGKDHAK